MVESAASTSFNSGVSSGALVDVVVVNFKVGEREGGFHVGSLGIDKLGGMRISSAFTEGLERAAMVVKRLHSQMSRFIEVSRTGCSKV